MKRFTLTVVFAVFCGGLFAQERFTIRVQDGEDINSLVSTSKYVFPEFKDGMVIFKDGTISKARMNYNMITNEMHYTDASGSVMALADQKDIASILFEDNNNRREFIYTSKGCTEVLAYSDGKALLLSRRIKVEQDRPSGAYGMPSDASAVERSNVLVSQGAASTYNVHNLTGENSVSLTVVQTIYLQSEKSIYTGGSRKNFERLFGKDKNQAIDGYIAKNNTDLKKPTDIILLFNYLVDMND